MSYIPVFVLNHMFYIVFMTIKHIGTENRWCLIPILRSRGVCAVMRWCVRVVLLLLLRWFSFEVSYFLSFSICSLLVWMMAVFWVSLLLLVVAYCCCSWSFSSSSLRFPCMHACYLWKTHTFKKKLIFIRIKSRKKFKWKIFIC